MAEDIRSVITAVCTGIEALTPTTDTSVPFRIIEDYPASSHDLVPANLKDRSILFFVQSHAHDARAFATGGRADADYTFVFRLCHDGKKRKAKEAEIVRAEDVAKLHHYFDFTQPAVTSGARKWTPSPDVPPQIAGNYVLTDIVVSVRTRHTLLA